MTPIEQKLAQALHASTIRSVPIAVTPQKDIGGFVVDFLIEAGDRKVVVECDGHEFHDRTPEQAGYDKARDRRLTAMGYLVLRFTGSEINRDATSCAAEVWDIALGRPAKFIRIQRGKPKARWNVPGAPPRPSPELRALCAAAKKGKT
jgi:very-short-patch-repair endonuclease